MEFSEIDLSAIAVTGWDGNSATFGDLPDPVVNNLKIYLVYTTVGSNFAGLWRASGGAWVYLGVPTDYNEDSNFSIINTADTTKVMNFDISGVTTGQTRTLSTPDIDGAIALSLTNVVKNANYTANPFELISCDISAGSFTVTLPDAPVDKAVVYVKLNTIGVNNYVELDCSGTDKFNEATGNTKIYLYLFGEYAQCQYDATTGLWYTFISAGTFNYATNFPGIDATTPITNADITFDTTARTLTITPPLGYFNIFCDGGGVIRRYRKVGNVVFPAWTDTSGTWFFYFDANGVAVTTQQPWTGSDFNSIAPIYRIIWNSTLVGAAKLVAQYIEYHLNTIPAETHRWEHANAGTIWMNGFVSASNALATTDPNADGRNTVIALSTGTNSDENLSYTVTNSVDALPWNQDLGDITPATLNATNSGLFKIFTQDAGSNISFLPATRFPFAWDIATNRPEVISSVGVRTLVNDNRWFVYFVYASQNSVNGDAIKLVSYPIEQTSIANARAINWTDIQNTYPIFGLDQELRPLYRIIFYNDNALGGAFPAGCKYSVLREIQDLRKAAVTNTSTASGSLPASSITFVPTSTIASTNVQTAIEEVASDSVPKVGLVLDEYADNAAALVGGLVIGNFYRTVDTVKIVHA